MRFEHYCSSRVVIVAGKGGVGKTTVTAALAVSATRAGMSVLVVEVEGKSGLANAFGEPPLTYRQVALEPGIEARTLTPDEALVEYLNDHGMKRISRRMAKLGVLDVVATAVPGMKDILVLGKVKQLEQARGAPDLVILDAPAAGHAVRFLTSPIGLLDAVRVGPISKQAADVAEMLADPARCQVVLVTLPEETPVNELIDTAFHLEDRVGVALAPVIINGCYPPAQLDAPATADHIRADAAAVGVGLADGTVRDLADAASFRAQRISLQQRQIERLSARLPLAQIRLPFIFRHEIGRTEVGLLADALGTGIEALPEADAA